MTASLIALLVVVLVGSTVQRVSGVGFAILVAPSVVLLQGPQAIVLSNLLGAIACAAVLISSWRDVDARRALLLAPAGLIGVLPGVYLSRHLPPGPLQMSIGLIILLGLGSALVSKRITLSPNTGTTVGMGLGSGFMTATAAVGGPALAFYAITTRWEQRAFAATVQISFMSQATLAVILKGVAHLPGVVPTLILMGAVVAGLLLGRILSGRVPPQGARTAAVLLALAGALATTVKGLLAWIG